MTSSVGEEGGYFGTFRVSDEGEVSFEPLGRAVYIVRIIKVHETGEVLLELKFDYLGRTVYITLPRGDLKKVILLDYAKKGMDAFEHTAYTLIECIQKQEEQITPIVGHKHIGWDSYDDEDGVKQPFFKAYKGIGHKSVYLGEFQIKPTGEIKDYREFISKYILNTPLELAVAVGCAAVLVGFIGPEVDCDNLFIHVYGDTSSGKTTFGVVSVAMGSKPEFKGQTLARRYSGTENALLQAFVRNTGLPACLDEAKSAKIRDFSSFIYSLESGVEKLRLDKDTSVKSAGEYHTSIVSTGEFSLSDDSERAAGKEIRLQQFGNIPWTRNANEAEAIKAFFRKNYGLPCVLLARYLLKSGKEAAVECFTRNRQKFIDASNIQDTFKERLSIKYGMILAAVELGNEAMSLGLSYDAILEMLVHNEAETAASRDIAQAAYDYIVGQINVYQQNFSYLNNLNGRTEIQSSLYKDTWGLKVWHKPPKEIGKKKCIATIYVQVDKLAELLHQGNFKDVSVIIKKWKERDLLDYEAGRNTRYRKITELGTKTHVYGIRVFENKGTAKNKSSMEKMKDLSELEE